MFADTGNDRNMYLGIVGVPQGIETARPRGDVTHIGQQNHRSEDNARDNDDQGKE